jgi:endonuclease/exonuclease/phosphatase family metal-dependent hydrolase
MLLQDCDLIDSWLEEEDIDRIFLAAEGTLPSTAVTEDELTEFQRIVDHLIKIRAGGSGYQQATLQ